MEDESSCDLHAVCGKGEDPLPVLSSNTWQILPASALPPLLGVCP
jgi:hypothetical protein